MDSKELFGINSSRRINEAIEKTFGKKINFETFDLRQLEDARNRLRTQISQVRRSSGFNENLENESFYKAQFMLDAINAELLAREESNNLDKFIDQETDEEFDKIDNEFTLEEGEVQQASAIVTAKTMVDRVGRWIEELSGMENETLLQLGDAIRDEMGQELSRSFLEQVAPAIQSALDNLKSTREILSNGVRNLATGESSDEMIGSEPSTEPEMGDDVTAAEPDTMNAEEPAADEFAAAEPAAGGAEAAGREQRENIEYQNRLLKVLAG